ncbi:hypothetical protein [Streptomyces sp. NPDC003717]|uniref:hypothetical protein n=1 Tax=Streptomyces sp. NPDC003717 TaxID=3154276 RepID=UPI0033AFD2A0
MSTSPTETFPALCGHSHLFPGARCRLQNLRDPGAFAAAPWPVEVDLRFSDGVVVDAVLASAGPGDDAPAVLTVPAYSTAAGTAIDGRTWLVREAVRVGSEVELTMGRLSPRSAT